jgi:hypothetical protein
VDRVAELVTDSSFRKDLLRLHGMAHTIINGAPKIASSKETIWEWAGALGIKLENVVEELHSTLGLLNQLAELVPEFPDGGDADVGKEPL